MIQEIFPSFRYVTTGFLIVLSTVILGCGGPNFSLVNKGEKTTLEGEVDAIEHSKVAFDKKELLITLVSLSSGEGVTLVGLHPSLSKGKKVLIEADFYRNIQGADIFKARKITPLKETQTPPEDLSKKEIPTPDVDPLTQLPQGKRNNKGIPSPQ